MEPRQTVLAKYQLVEDMNSIGDRRILMSESKAETTNMIHLVNLFALPILIFMSGLSAVTMF